MQTALREMHAVGESIKPADLVQQLREQIDIDGYLANEQLPKEIDAKRSIVHDLSRVASQPAIDQSDIVQLQQRVVDQMHSMDAFFLNSNHICLDRRNERWYREAGRRTRS